MSVSHAALLVSLLAATLATLPVRADTFGESFDDGSIDATLSSLTPPGFAVAVESQALAMTKVGGTGDGEAILRAAEVTRVDLAGVAELGLRAVFAGGKTAEIHFVGADTLRATIDASTVSEMQSAATATLRERRSGNDVSCEIDTGSGFATKNSASSVQLGKAKVRLDRTKLASTEIPQLGCGPATPGAKGPKIEKQPKHAAKLGLFIANQLGALRLDTTKEVEFCVPSFVELPIA